MIALPPLVLHRRYRLIVSKMNLLDDRVICVGEEIAKDSEKEQNGENLHSSKHKEEVM